MPEEARLRLADGDLLDDLIALLETLVDEALDETLIAEESLVDEALMEETLNEEEILEEEAFKEAFLLGLAGSSPQQRPNAD